MNALNDTSVQSLFYDLFRERQFKSDSPQYKLLTQDEAKRQALMDMAASFHCHMAWYPSAMYLIPDADNDFLGYSRSDLYKKFGSGEKAAMLNLRLFIMLVLLLCFYGGSSSNRKVRPFLQLEDLMHEVETRLKDAAENEKNADTKAVTYQTLYHTYQSLSGEDNRKANSRMNLYKKTIAFLEEEDLIIWYPNDEQIRTMPMLDDKVDYMLRSEAYAHLFEQLKGGKMDADAG